MASKAVLLLGAAAAAGVALFAFGKKANASEPRGFPLPPNAVRLHLPAVNGGIAIDAAEYPAAPGQPPGKFTILWDPANDETFVALFTPAGTTNPAIMSVGKTANSQLLLSTVPNLIARMQAGR